MQPSLFLTWTKILGDENLSILSKEETGFYQGFLPLQRRQQFLTGRSLLKTWVSKTYGETDLTQISLHSNPPHLKPVLFLRGKLLSEVSVSLSHKKNQVALAVGSYCPVGIDLEEFQIHRHAKRLQDFLCHPQEKLELQGLEENPTLYHSRLTELWTLKEATLKFLGEGIFGKVSPTEIKADWSGQTLTVHEHITLYWKNFVKEDFTLSVVTNSIGVSLLPDLILKISS